MRKKSSKLIVFIVQALILLVLVWYCHASEIKKIEDLYGFQIRRSTNPVCIVSPSTRLICAYIKNADLGFYIKTKKESLHITNGKDFVGGIRLVKKDNQHFWAISQWKDINTHLKYIEVYEVPWTLEHFKKLFTLNQKGQALVPIETVTSVDMQKRLICWLDERDKYHVYGSLIDGDNIKFKDILLTSEKKLGPFRIFLYQNHFWISYIFFEDKLANFALAMISNKGEIKNKKIFPLRLNYLDTSFLDIKAFPLEKRIKFLLSTNNGLWDVTFQGKTRRFTKKLVKGTKNKEVSGLKTVNNEGRPFIVMALKGKTTNSVCNIYFSFLNSDVVWQPLQKVNLTTSSKVNAYFPDIAIIDNENLAISWIDHRLIRGNTYLRIAKISKNFVKWEDKDTNIAICPGQVNEIATDLISLANNIYTITGYFGSDQMKLPINVLVRRLILWESSKERR